MADLAVISEPNALLFAAPNRAAEAVDELLFGMEVQVVERPEDGWVRVRAPYDYGGYLPECALGLAAAVEGGTEVVVCARFTDLLREPDFRKGALCSLPRGAGLHAVSDGASRFVRVRLPDGGDGFVHRDHVAPPPVWRGDRGQVVDAAMGYLGTPYRWGGKTPAGIDCSGLCFMAYWLCGREICRDAVLLERYMRPVSLEAAGPGDCLYFPGHVALYLGAGRFLHANGLRGGVTVNSLRREAPDFAPELAGKLLGVGTVFT